MRWLSLSLLGALLLLAFSTGKAQEKNQDKDKVPFLETPYYPLQVGNTWNYKTKEGNAFTMKVTAHEKVADVLCARVVLLSDNKEQAVEHIGVTSTGVYRYSFGTVKPDKPVPILKLPPKAGEGWTLDSKALNEVLKGTFKVSEEEVKVPAGTFKAFKVATDDLDANGLKIDSSTWYASGTGMVMQVIKVGTTTTTVELQKFEPGKK